MSRTNKTTDGVKSPASKFISWASGSKAWVYWDKQTETEVAIPHGDIAFIVLDQLNTAKGFDESAHSGIWANEVRNCGSDPMTLRNKNGIIAEGLWKDIKGRNGSKFTKSVYAMAKIDGEYELVNFQLSGSSLSAWFEFCEESPDLCDDIVVATKDTVEGRKGAVVYNVPVFSIIAKELSPAAATKADEMDHRLQVYLDQYLSKSEDPPVTDKADDTPAPEPEPEIEENPF